MNNIKLKISMKNILFIMLILIYCLTASDKAGVKGSLYKYVVLLLGIIDGVAFYLKKKKMNERIIDNSVKPFFIFVLMIIIYSVVRSVYVFDFSFRVFQELAFLLCPFVYALLFVNNSKSEELNRIMIIGLYLSFGIYIISLGMNVNEIINAAISSSFLESSSSLESAIYSGLALAFAFYFIYRDNKINRIISLFFVLMTFKRFSILMAIILFVISHCKKMRKIKITSKWFIFSVILVFSLTILFYFSLIPKNKKVIEENYKINYSSITTTRSDRFEYLYNSNYMSCGFGSSNEYLYNKINGALEMDLVRIIVELGFIPLFLLIYSYLNLTRNNLYCYIFMVLKLIGLVVTSSLTNSIPWSIAFIAIFCIKNEEEENAYINNNSSI